MEVFYGLRSTKPENSRPRCAATGGHKFLTCREFLICTNLRIFFTKPTPPLDPSTSDLQDPRISGPEDKPRAFTCLLNHWCQFHAPPHPATRLYVLHVPSSTMTSWMTSLWRHRPLRSDPFDQADPVWPIYPDPVRTASNKKKKKKKKRKMLWPSGPLTLTKKSKFSKQTCPTQFFKYIPILGPVSSFEAQKLCKCPVSKSWLLHKCWPKSQFLRSTCLAQFFM